jgi:hypothetical protein
MVAAFSRIVFERRPGRAQKKGVSCIDTPFFIHVISVSAGIRTATRTGTDAGTNRYRSSIALAQRVNGFDKTVLFGFRQTGNLDLAKAQFLFCCFFHVRKFRLNVNGILLKVSRNMIGDTT